MISFVDYYNYSMMRNSASQIKSWPTTVSYPTFSFTWIKQKNIIYMELCIYTQFFLKFLLIDLTTQDFWSGSIFTNPWLSVNTIHTYTIYSHKSVHGFYHLIRCVLQGKFPLIYVILQCLGHLRKLLLATHFGLE